MSILVILVAILAAVVAGLVWFTRATARKAEAAVPPRGSFVQISTGRLHYVDRGTGPAVVMIHGLGTQLGNFDQFLIDALADTHRCIALDRPGMGWSDRPEEAPANPRAQAAQVVELIDALGLERPLIVGHSLGGAIALCLALDHPDKCRGLALLAPLTRAGDPPSPIFAPLAITSPLVRRLAAHTLATPLGLRNTAAVLDVVFGPDPVPEDYAIAGGAYLGLRPSAFINTSRDFMASTRDMRWMAEGYDRIAVPVHILYGSDDRTLSVQTQARDLVARHPQFRLTEVPGGHMLPLTHPTQSAAFIRAADATTA